MAKLVVAQRECAMATSQHHEIEVLDSWEDIADSDILEKKFNNLKPPSHASTRRCNGAAINIILTGDDALRSQYVPPEPTVKILKRPTKQCHTNNHQKALQPMKTLKQREQEYAEARLRILGAGPSPAEKIEEASRASSKLRTRHNDENVLRLPKGPDGTRGFGTR